MKHNSRLAYITALTLGVIAQTVHAIDYKFTDDYMYSVSGSEVTIHSYDNYDTSDTIAEIPSTLDGLPVTTLDGSGFAGRHWLTEVIIPDSVKTIGMSCFSGCISLSTITIPSSVVKIDSKAFSECTGLEVLELSPGIRSIGMWAFEKCTSLIELKIPSSIDAIDYAAFSDCTALTTVTISSSTLTRIEAKTFFGCSQLTEFVIPPKVSVIGLSAFEDCISLGNLTIPPGVTRIGDYAFRNCTKIGEITFLGNAPTVSVGAFSSFRKGFRFNCFGDAKGFTFPTWQGYPITPLNSQIVIQQPAGVTLVDGRANKSFGSLAVGKPGGAKRFIVKNTGRANLTGLTVSRSGPAAKDFIITQPKPTLAPGTSTAFKVTFKPTATGTRRATLYIRSNDKDESPFEVQLTGVGTNS